MSFHHGDPWGRPPPPPPNDDNGFYGPPDSPSNALRGSSPWGFGAPAPSASPTQSRQPPLPPPSLQEHDQPFYHVPYPQHRAPQPHQHQHQQLHHHPHSNPLAPPPQSPFFSPFGSPPPPSGPMHSNGPPSASPSRAFFSPAGNAGFDLSSSMGGLRLRDADSRSFPSSSPTGGSFGSIGSIGSSSVTGNAPPSDPWSSSGLSSDRMRDQMNLQMASLYREQQPRHLNHQPLAHSGGDLLGLLQSSGRSNEFPAMGEDSRPRPPPLSLSSSFPPPAPLHLQQHDGHLQFNGEELLSSLLSSSSHDTVPRSHLSSSWDDRGDRFLSSPRPSMQRANSSHGPQMMARSPTQQHYHHPRDGFDGMARSLPPSRSPFNSGGSGFEPLTRRDSGSGLSFGSSSSGSGGSTAAVSPDVTKPNDTIKVQVSLLTDECRLGRVLLIGLFRIGQPTNEKPIFVKQVLFENKIHRQARHWNTRITFRAPRSPGEFEFRIFEELKPRQRDDRDNNGNDYDSNNANGFYSNATIVRSNRLKVAMDYSHFIEFLRSITEKFRQNRLKRDTGGILSNLLAFMRLIDQIETVFLHGQALLEDFITDLLHLVSIDEHEMSRFPVTDTIPSPIETFHGTIRNVLNSVQANPWIKELVTTECLQQVEFYQKRLYCAVSGLYFRSEEDKAQYWKHHYQFEPLTTPVDTTTESYASFVDGALSKWIESEAAKLMPHAEEFRRQRQAIYQVVYHNVVRRLDGGIEADLDVFGSSANDFGNADSDMDMCLVLRPEAVVNSMTMDDKRRLLSQAIGHLESRPDLFKEIDASRLSARIPIVMFKMADTGLECDLCVENVLAQRNTSLLRAYANADDRVRVLAFVLKQFVKRRRMNCAAESTLSSYGYLLMLIHFLQRQDPPVLPVLQTLPPSWNGEPLCHCTSTEASCPPRAPFCRLTERTEDVVKARQLPSVLARTPGTMASEAIDAAPPSSTTPTASPSTAGQVESYFYDPYELADPAERLSLLRSFGARNKSSVGALLVGFFQYYGLAFDASTHVVSVRMAREQLKSEKKTQHQWKLHSRLSIEDPFEVAYDVAHVLKGTRDKYIRQQFVRAYTLLMEAAAASTRTDADHVMRVVNEPVHELPFHNYKDGMHLSAMASAMAAGDAAAATAASVLGGLFNDPFFDASSLAD